MWIFQITICIKWIVSRGYWFNMIQKLSFSFLLLSLNLTIYQTMSLFGLEWKKNVLSFLKKISHKGSYESQFSDSSDLPTWTSCCKVSSDFSGWSWQLKGFSWPFLSCCSSCSSYEAVLSLVHSKRLLFSYACLLSIELITYSVLLKI